jgi:hypothetical protein
MGRMLVAAAAIVLLAACAATVRDLTFKDGTKGYEVQCSGVQRSMSDCESKARQLCPNGYDTHGSMNGGAGAFAYQRFINISCKT